MTNATERSFCLVIWSGANSLVAGEPGGQRRTSSLLCTLNRGFACRIDPLRRRRAGVFHHAGPAIDGSDLLRLQMMETLRIAHSRFGINLGIRNRPIEFEDVVVGALVALLEMHLLAVRVTEMIDPGSVTVDLPDSSYEEICDSWRSTARLFSREGSPPRAPALCQLTPR